MSKVSKDVCFEIDDVRSCIDASSLRVRVDVPSGDRIRMRMSLEGDDDLESSTLVFRNHARYKIELLY